MRDPNNEIYPHLVDLYPSPTRLATPKPPTPPATDKESTSTSRNDPLPTRISTRRGGSNNLFGAGRNDRSDFHPMVLFDIETCGQIRVLSDAAEAGFNGMRPFLVEEFPAKSDEFIDDTLLRVMCNQNGLHKLVRDKLRRKDPLFDLIANSAKKKELNSLNRTMYKGKAFPKYMDVKGSGKTMKEMYQSLSIKFFVRENVFYKSISKDFQLYKNTPLSG